MATTKKTDPAGSAKNTPGGHSSPSSILAIPRFWLITLAVLVVGPWLVVAAIYWRARGESTALNSPEPPVASAPAKQASAGPWGNLTVTPIVISPPIEYVADDWGQTETKAVWHFPGVTVEMLEAFLQTAGMSVPEISRVKAASRTDAGTKGLVVTPDPELLRGMKPEVRTRLYLQLAKSPLNFDQANAFRFLGSSPESWFAGSTIAQNTRNLVIPFIYSDGIYQLFSDDDYVRSQLTDPLERRRLAKTLLRQSTVLLKLTIGQASEVEPLADYWGRGGRRTDLRPLLESVAGAASNHAVDIVHLLPTFARNHLYRYPKITAEDLNQPMLNNCLWTALNFFRAVPENKYLDPQAALSALKNDYYIVENSFQLGDVVAFLDGNDVLFHVAVYLADDFVFTKNGTSPVSPWFIMTINQLKDFYRRRADPPRLIYHRRNDL
jgi:hypothetical protein